MPEQKKRTCSRSVIETDNVQFDERKFISSYIKPLADKLSARCSLYGISIVFSCVEYDSDKETRYEGTFYPPQVMYNDKGERNSLTNDMFIKYLFEMAGYNKEYTEIETEKL